VDVRVIFAFLCDSSREASSFKRSRTFDDVWIQV